MTFSSIVSCIGNVGQADYSAANYFLDCLTEFRYNRNASGKSISINWSLWEDGGMGLTEQHKRIFPIRQDFYEEMMESSPYWMHLIRYQTD